MDVFRSVKVTDEPIVVVLTDRPSPLPQPKRKSIHVNVQPTVTEAMASPLPSDSIESMLNPSTGIPITVLKEVETMETTKPTSTVVIPETVPTMKANVFSPTVFVDNGTNITALDEPTPSVDEIGITNSNVSGVENTNSSETPISPTEEVNSDISVVEQTVVPEVERTSAPGIRYLFSKRGMSSRGRKHTEMSKAMEYQQARNRSQVSLTTISSLGFDYRSYYRQNSFVPINISDPISEWISGSSQFRQYMNTVFLPQQKKHILDRDKLIVYAKRGTTGIAGQMSGMCDVLLLAILNNRVFQCLRVCNSSLSRLRTSCSSSFFQIPIV